MLKQMQETELKLSKEQLQTAITNQLTVDQGLNDVFSMVLNGLMYAERSTFLNDDKSEGNKGNGYRQAQRSGLG